MRAGIVVTGTEVLSGLIADANGPWLSERLREHGVTLTHTVVVGDRPDDLRASLSFLAGLGCDLIVTSGGLGPTADDLTAEVVAEFCGREFALDEALEERVWAVVSRLHKRFPRADTEAMRAGARKQAYVPAGAAVLEPVGTAPGLLVPGEGLLVVVLPGPPRELQPMWAAAIETEPLRALLAGTGELERRIIRMYGVPEAELAAALREVSEGTLAPLEITTCLRRGELEVSTVFASAAEAAYDELEDILIGDFSHAIFSHDGATIDEVVARRLEGRTVATAESCTGGLMAGRLTDLAGSSAYVLGGVVVYSNEAKTALAGVPAELIAAHGAVSPEVARALAAGARARFGADFGIGITGIAGPGGGTPEKPVGTVCLCVSSADEARELTVRLPGSRADVRDRTTTTAMHMLRELLPPEPERAVRHANRGSPGRALRLFVALELPEPVRDALTELAAAADPDVWRAVKPEGIHVTLAFLGSRPAADVDAIESLLPAGARSIPLRLAGAEVLPPRRGRVLTARIDDPSGALAELQAGLSARLEQAGLYTPEKRPFHAHATVARLRARARPPRSVDLPLEPLEFTARAVTLYVSRLHPSGARYEPLVRTPLGG